MFNGQIVLLNEVEDEVRELWSDANLNNDEIFKTTLGHLMTCYPVIAQYIIEQESTITDSDDILISWWW